MVLPVSHIIIQRLDEVLHRNSERHGSLVEITPADVHEVVLSILVVADNQQQLIVHEL